MGLQRRTTTTTAPAATASSRRNAGSLLADEETMTAAAATTPSSTTTGSNIRSTTKGTDNSNSSSGSSSDSSDAKTIAILLLAHDGVANPALWERWRRSSGPAYAARLRFFVFRNERLSFPSAFADAYDLGLRLPTQWCASSTTHASLQAVGRVLEADPQCAQVFLVSGRDIPVFPPRALFHPRRVTTEGTRYHLRPFGSIVCQAEPCWQEEIKDEELWEEAAAGRNPFEALIRDAAVCHNTFLALSRRHARLLLRFPRECPKAYKQLLRLGDHKRFIPITCPEEWLLGTMLRLLLNAPGADPTALLARVHKLTADADVATTTTTTKKKKQQQEKKAAPAAAAAAAAATATPSPATAGTVRRGSSSSSSSSSGGSSSWTDGEEGEGEDTGSIVSLPSFSDDEGEEAADPEPESESESDSEEEEEDDEEEAPPAPVRVTRSRVAASSSSSSKSSSSSSKQADAAVVLLEEDRYAREVVDWPLTDQNRKEADDPSPLTWTSWERDAHLVLYAPGEKRRWTLRDALASAKANGHLFYRKVGPLRGEEVAALCRELYGDGDQEEEGTSSSSSSSSSSSIMMLSPSSYSIEAALLARAAKRARHGGGGSSSTSGFLSPDGAAGSETTKPAGRRYTLRVPTRHCVADGSGGLYCALLPTTAAAANIIKSAAAAAAAAGGEDGDMAIRRGRLETLAKGRR